MEGECEANSSKEIGIVVGGSGIAPALQILNECIPQPRHTYPPSGWVGGGNMLLLLLIAQHYPHSHNLPHHHSLSLGDLRGPASHCYGVWGASGVVVFLFSCCLRGLFFFFFFIIQKTQDLVMLLYRYM